MKQHILPALRLTVVCIVIFMIVYPALIWGIAKAAPAGGTGEKVVVNGTVRGYKTEGQSFTQDKYFWGRPSAVGYNAAGSAGSNKGPSNPDYLQVVRDRVDSFLAHNPTVNKADIPSEMVTASGSGLDPDISVKAAQIQVQRIAKERNVSAERIAALITASTESSINGIKKINVLQINIALDNLK